MQDQIFTERFDCSSTSGSRNFSDVVTDFRPFERWIRPCSDIPRSNSSHHYFEGRPNLIGKLDGELDGVGNNSEEEEDAIEDC
jgi:cell cycle checkpoint protein